jgi:hypothetical protein
MRLSSLGRLREIKAAPSNQISVGLYRVTRSADRSGYEARPPRHTGPRSYPSLSARRELPISTGTDFDWDKPGAALGF